MPVALTIVTIVPEMNKPKAIVGMATRGGILKAQAATAPVQAPVRGRGIPTKTIKARDRYLENKFAELASILTLLHVRSLPMGFGKLVINSPNR